VLKGQHFKELFNQNIAFALLTELIFSVTLTSVIYLSLHFIFLRCMECQHRLAMRKVSI